MSSLVFFNNNKSITATINDKTSSGKFSNPLYEKLKQYNFQEGPWDTRQGKTLSSVNNKELNLVFSGFIPVGVQNSGYAQNVVFCNESGNEFIFCDAKYATQEYAYLFLCNHIDKTKFYKRKGEIWLNDFELSKQVSLIKGDLKTDFDKGFNLSPLFFQEGYFSNLYISNYSQNKGDKFTRDGETYYCIWKNIYCKFNGSDVVTINNKIA